MLSEGDLRESLHKRLLGRREAVLVIMSVDADAPKSIAAIKTIARKAGFAEVTKWNISDILAKARGLVMRLPEGWSLTARGRTFVMSLDVFPKRKGPRAVNAVEELRSAVSALHDKNCAKFLGEALACFEAELYRACVVLSWVGAVALLYRHVVANCLPLFNAEASRRDTKWKPARTADDLTRMKESEFLDIIGGPPLSVIGRNVKEQLKNNCLRLRNACGHPSSLAIGENTVAAHLEILILNVFSRFS